MLNGRSGSRRSRTCRPRRWPALPRDPRQPSTNGPSRGSAARRGRRRARRSPGRTPPGAPPGRRPRVREPCGLGGSAARDRGHEASATASRATDRRYDCPRRHCGMSQPPSPHGPGRWHSRPDGRHDEACVELGRPDAARHALERSWRRRARSWCSGTVSDRAAGDVRPGGPAGRPGSGLLAGLDAFLRLPERGGAAVDMPRAVARRHPCGCWRRRPGTTAPCPWSPERPSPAGPVLDRPSWRGRRPDDAHGLPLAPCSCSLDLAVVAARPATRRGTWTRWADLRRPARRAGAHRTDVGTRRTRDRGAPLPTGELSGAVNLHDWIDELCDVLEHRDRGRRGPGPGPGPGRALATSSAGPRRLDGYLLGVRRWRPRAPTRSPIEQPRRSRPRSWRGRGTALRTRRPRRTPPDQDPRRPRSSTTAATATPRASRVARRGRRPGGGLAAEGESALA